MATLNIKGFPDDLYDSLREMAEQEHRSISQQVVHLLSQVTKPAPRISWLEQAGVDRALWKDVDVAAYVAAERDSWD